METEAATKQQHQTKRPENTGKGEESGGAGVLIGKKGGRNKQVPLTVASWAGHCRSNGGMSYWIVKLR